MTTETTPELPWPQTAIEILCEWAWAKVNLENLQRVAWQSTEEGAAKTVNAIQAYRHALRKKKKLDEEYREHHEALAMQEACRRLNCS